MLIKWYLRNHNLWTRSTRKVLVTGSVPTENLAQKSHEIENKERRSIYSFYIIIASYLMMTQASRNVVLIISIYGVSIALLFLKLLSSTFT